MKTILMLIVFISCCSFSWSDYFCNKECQKKIYKKGFNRGFVQGIMTEPLKPPCTIKLGKDYWIVFPDDIELYTFNVVDNESTVKILGEAGDKFKIIEEKGEWHDQN